MIVFAIALSFAFAMAVCPGSLARVLANANVLATSLAFSTRNAPHPITNTISTENKLDG